MNNEGRDPRVDVEQQRARREQWYENLQTLAEWNQGMAPTVRRHDEALANSLEFCALRLHRLAARIAIGHPK